MVSTTFYSRVGPYIDIHIKYEQTIQGMYIREAVNRNLRQLLWPRHCDVMRALASWIHKDIVTSRGLTQISLRPDPCGPETILLYAENLECMDGGMEGINQFNKFSKWTILTCIIWKLNGTKMQSQYPQRYRSNLLKICMKIFAFIQK